MTERRYGEDKEKRRQREVYRRTYKDNKCAENTTRRENTQKIIRR